MQASLILATMLPMLRAKLEALETESLKIEIPGIDLYLHGEIYLLSENGLTAKTIAVTVETTGGIGTMRLWSV